mmetsp:Transcript_11282/g.27379  ORF Transcript_11282/g.27379 Transcript_11282/m.27379 type:complete len:893 (+) Transcript_11282:103-2781(+)
MRAGMRAFTVALLVACAAGQGTTMMAPASMGAYCAPGCNTTHQGNGMCDFMCMTEACGFDSMMGPSDCSPTYAFNLNTHPKAIIAANDVDGNMRLNFTEAQTYWGQLTLADYNTRNLTSPAGMDYYEVGLMVFDTAMCSMMMNPSAAIDWDVWGQPTAFWMLNIADDNMDGSLSPEELSATWPNLDANMKRSITNSSGHATVKTLAVQLGQLGSALHGQGISPFWTAESLIDLLRGMFDKDGMYGLSAAELAPLCLDPGLIMEFDTDKNHAISFEEGVAMIKVINTDPCAGFLELKGQKMVISAQIPLMPQKCAWLVNPNWFYQVPEMSNASLYQTATNLFGVMPNMPASMTVVSSPPVRRLMSVEEESTVRATEGRIAANVPDRRLLAILPSARVDSEDTVMQTRAMGAPVMTNEVPYSVALLTGTDQHVCDGVLVNPKYVLTTASCAMSNQMGKALIGGLTGMTGQSGVDEIMVAGVVSHPSYSIDHTNDVALVELQDMSSKTPISLYDGSDVGFTDCKMMSIMALSRQAGMLTKKTVQAVDHAACSEHYWWYYGTRGAIGRDVVCVQGDVDNCDSTLTKGSALYAVTPSGRHMLLGIKGDISVCNPLPVTYTRASEVRQWVLSNMKGGAVHPATKLTVEVKKILMPQHGTLNIYQGTAEHPGNMAVSLDSKCQAGHMSDDGGMGGVLIVYQPGNGTRDTSCGPSCLDMQGFEIEVETVGCEDNFMKQGNWSKGSCEDPMWHDNMGHMGGIAGCTYHMPMGGMPASCASPMCEMTERWQALGPMEVAGNAFAGGLGHRMTKNQTHEFGVWTCVRDWNEEEQLRCAVRPNELGCYWFEEKTRVWSWRGVNGEARLVEKARYEQGLDAEETRLAQHVLLPGPRKEALGHFEM